MSASCRFALPTCYTLLQDAKQFANTKVPLSIVFRPFAEPKGYEPPVPVIDHSKGGLIRCTRCNSFLNPFYTFSGDRTFVCNLCDMKNELPPGVSLSSLDQNEVKAAVYDIIMPKEFHMKPMVKPYLLFCIELTKPFIELGSSSS
jgi:protein transport protein SEC24